MMTEPIIGHRNTAIDHIYSFESRRGDVQASPLFFIKLQYIVARLGKNLYNILHMGVIYAR